jgi:tetratricopeptide (TPR) repeat protein
MGLIERNKKETLKTIPEDVKRYLMREIEKWKTDSPAVHYQFAHHLLIKYQSVMNIFVASGSTPSEIEELKHAHAFCLNAVEDDKNLLWICNDCKKVIGVFKNTIHCIDAGQFTEYLLTLINSCPSCEGKEHLIMKSNFLLSGLILEQALGLPPLENDQKDRTTQLIWMTLNAEKRDLKTSIKEFKNITGDNNTLKDMLREGRIQNVFQNDKEGHWYSFFGRMTPEDKKRFGIKEEVNEQEIRRIIKEGFDFLNKNCFEEANRCFGKVLRHKPSGPIWGAQGMALAGLNKNEDALECFNKCLEMDPQNEFIWKNKANLLSNRLQKYEEAVDCYDKLLSFNEKDVNIWKKKANSLFELQKYEKAVECFSNIISIQDNDSNAWYSKAYILYNHLHRNEEGIECFKKAADLGNPSAIDCLKQLGL